MLGTWSGTRAARGDGCMPLRKFSSFICLTHTTPGAACLVINNNFPRRSDTRLPKDWTLYIQFTTQMAIIRSLKYSHVHTPCCLAGYEKFTTACKKGPVARLLLLLGTKYCANVESVIQDVMPSFELDWKIIFTILRSVEITPTLKTPLGVVTT